MRTSILSHVIVAALLAAASAPSLADTFQLRLPQKGVRAGGTTPLPPAQPGGGTEQPPGGQEYATSGVQFLRNGIAINQLYLEPNEVAVVTLRNTSNLPLRGWLLTSTGGGTRADMTGTTCSQDTASTVPVTLAPGAECSFRLIARFTEIRTDDTFPFRSLSQQAIPGVLSLPGNGGGSTLPPDM